MNEKNNNFQKNLKYQMTINKKKVVDVAKGTGASPSTVYMWIRGERVPRYDSIKLLADYFKCDISELTDSPEQVQGKSVGVRIPVVGSVVAGVPIDAVENIIDYEEITSELARSGEYFALRIQGDSMEPRMEEGDIVIVRKQETIENGQVAIVLVNGYEATVKEVHITSDGIELRGYNENFETIRYSAMDIMSLPVKIIGRVVECRQKY